MILMIDNFDSFTYNLVQAVAARGCEVVVRRNNAIDVDGVRVLNPSSIIISPGPGTPDDAGISLDLIKNLAGLFPSLGLPRPPVHCTGLRRQDRQCQEGYAWKALANLP